MPTGKQKKGKKASQIQQEVPCTGFSSPTAGEESESEFAAVEKTLEQSLSHDTLTWMRHIIRVQAEEVTKAIMKQEKEESGALETSRATMTTKEIDDLKKKLHDLQQDIDNLKSENVRRKREIERLEYTNSKKQTTIDDLKIKLDELEQERHQQSVQIVGLPENKNETDDIKQLTKVFKEKAGVKMKPSEVVEMKRLGKRSDKKTRNIIVKFKDQETRQKIYKERKKLITTGSPNKSVYVNDSLTQHRQQLLYAARQLVKQRKIYAAWSQAGNILVRKKEDSKIIHVRGNNDLMIIKSDEMDPEQESSHQPEETSSDLTHLSGYSYYCDSDI